MSPQLALAPARQAGPIQLDAGGDQSTIPALERLEIAVDRLLAMLARNRDKPTDHGLLRLLCVLCLVSGKDFQMHRLTAMLPATNGPIRADDVIAAMANLGFHATRRRHIWGRLRPDDLPLLFLPDRGEPAVVFRCPSSDGIRLMRVTGPSEPVTSPGRGAIWTFARNEEHQLDKTQRTHTGDAWFRAVLGLFPRVGLALLLTSLAAGFAAVLLPLFTIQTYAQVISLGSAEPLPAFVVGMLLVVTIEALLLTLRKRMLAFTANRIEYLIGTMSFERILKIRASVSARAAVTDQAARLRTVENVRDFATGPAFVSILEMPAAFAALVAIGFLAGWIAVVPVVVIAAHLGVFFQMRRQAQILTNIAAEESTEMQRITIETFEKRDAIREAGLQDLWQERMVGCARRQQSAQMRLRMNGSAAESMSTFVLMAGTMALLVAGTEASWAGTIGPGGLLAILILGLRALTPFHALCLSTGRFEQLRNSVNQINQLMDVPLERDPDRVYAEARALRGAVSLLNAGFRATDTRPVFVGLDIEIEPGDVVAITGANGSGKSTVLKLIMGLSDLSLGAVRIDGTDMRQFAPDELRRKIAYVPQQPILFPGTLRENLQFVRPMASPEKMRRALQAAGLAEAIDLLPGGIDHGLTASDIAGLPPEFTFKFSFAQAMLTESRLLLIDEIPNGLLDGAVGDTLRRFLASNGKRRTVIFVSHRSDFLELAERVIVLRYGKVPSVSTPAKLLTRAA